MNFDRKTGWNLIAELDDKSTNALVRSYKEPRMDTNGHE